MKLKSLLIIAALPVMLVSCLKSKDSLGLIADGGSITTGIFERFYYGELRALALDALPINETVSFITVRYSAPKKPAGTIHVTLAIDNNMVTNYNNANGTTFVTLPANAYTLPSGLDFDLPAGSSGEFDFQIALNKGNLNLQNVYAIGLKISSVSEGVIAALEKDIVVSILVKNAYHGTYLANGYFYHPSAPRDIIDLPKDIVTTGPYSVKVDLGDLGGAGYKSIFTVDPATNIVTITPAPGSPGNPLQIWTSGLPTTNPGYTAAWPGSALCNNTYNPATKTFYVRYGYLGGSGYRVTEEAIVRQ